MALARSCFLHTRFDAATSVIHYRLGSVRRNSGHSLNGPTQSGVEQVEMCPDLVEAGLDRRCLVPRSQCVDRIR